MIRAKYLISAFVVVGTLATLQACGIRKKEVNEQLETYKSKQQLSLDQSYVNQVTELFDDSLRGSFQVADTSGTDSGTFESKGVKVKFRVTGGKPGTKVDFEAVAKPVARSTLNAGHNKLKTNGQEQSKVLNVETKKTVNPLPGWLWLVLIVAIIAALYQVYRKVKNKLT